MGIVLALFLCCCIIVCGLLGFVWWGAEQYESSVAVPTIAEVPAFVPETGGTPAHGRGASNCSGACPNHHSAARSVRLGCPPARPLPSQVETTGSSNAIATRSAILRYFGCTECRPIRTIPRRPPWPTRPPTPIGGLRMVTVSIRRSWKNPPQNFEDADLSHQPALLWQ